MISDPAALTAEISDPATSTQRLVEIAGSFSEFGPLVAEHPNASVDVLSYLLKHGDDATRKAAARRRARDVALITTRQRAPEVEVQPAPQGEVQPAPVVEHSPEVQSEPDSQPESMGEPETQPQVQAPAGEENLTVPVQPLRHASPAAFRSAPPLDEELDNTQLSQRSREQTWRISIDGAGEVTFTATDILIGRKPSTRPEHPQSELVTVPDSTKTVSKTHARMVLRGDQWVIIDLESTNGVFVETPRGEHRVVAGSEITVTGKFSLGDLRLNLEQG